jgi:hypothetical protein
MTMDLQSLIQSLLTIALGGIAGYLAGYSKKKGENLATKEDMKDVLEQVSAVTATTKKIEAEISSDVWDRQKRWELKRDILLQAARRMSDTQKAVLKLEAILKVETENAKNGTSSDLSQQQNDALTEWHSAMFAADEIALLVNVVCGRDSGQLFTNLNSVSEQTVKRILAKDTSAYGKACGEIGMKAGLVRDFIRRQLGTK